MAEPKHKVSHDTAPSKSSVARSPVTKNDESDFEAKRKGEGIPSDLHHDRGGANDTEEIDRMKREAANPPMPFDTRTDAQRAAGEPIPLPAGAQPDPQAGQVAEDRRPKSVSEKAEDK